MEVKEFINKMKLCTPDTERIVLNSRNSIELANFFQSQYNYQRKEETYFEDKNPLNELYENYDVKYKRIGNFQFNTHIEFYEGMEYFANIDGYSVYRNTFDHKIYISPFDEPEDKLKIASSFPNFLNALLYFACYYAKKIMGEEDTIDYKQIAVEVGDIETVEIYKILFRE